MDFGEVIGFGTASTPEFRIGPQTTGEDSGMSWTSPW
jgi:hypothetical protein